MRRLTAALALAGALAAAAPLAAQPLDPAAGEALSTTLKMLLDPTLRSATIAGNPQAGAADQQIRSLTGSDALTQELFALAADVFQELTQASGGDATKMAQRPGRRPHRPRRVRRHAEPADAGAPAPALGQDLRPTTLEPGGYRARISRHGHRGPDIEVRHGSAGARRATLGGLGGPFEAPHLDQITAIASSSIM